MNGETLLAIFSFTGFVVTLFLWSRARREAMEHKSEALVWKTRLEESDKHSPTQKLEETFKALASDTLKSQTDSFLQIATERLDKKVDPIEKTLLRVQNELGDFERRRGEQFGQLTENLRHMMTMSEQVQKEARILSTALRRPEVRGSWGEIQLRRVAELAGMAAHCDFEEQTTVGTDNRYRPDMVVHLPNGRVVVVDSKAVMSAYIEAQETPESDRRRELTKRHAQNLRSRVDELTRKAYWEQVTDQTSRSIDLVVLFVPNEAFLQAAVEADPSLIEDALSSKVMICTATTLVALLKAIAFGWQENQLTENAQAVIKAAKELYDRVFPWVDHLERLGRGLRQSIKSYDDAVGSLNSRVLPAVRRLKELGLKESKDLEDLAALGSGPEAMPTPPESQ